jgi:hypothetical protein
MVTFEMNHLMCFAARLFLRGTDQTIELRMLVKLVQPVSQKLEGHTCIYCKFSVADSENKPILSICSDDTSKASLKFPYVRIVKYRTMKMNNEVGRILDGVQRSCTLLQRDTAFW